MARFRELDDGEEEGEGKGERGRVSWRKIFVGVVGSVME